MNKAQKALKAYQDKHGYWYEAGHPEHPIQDWRYEIVNNDTRLGYWEWCHARAEE